MEVRRIAGRLIKGLKPEYLEAYNEEFVQKFLRPIKVEGKRYRKRPLLGARQVAELRKVFFFSSATFVRTYVLPFSPSMVAF